jgi:hypothetical protein
LVAIELRNKIKSIRVLIDLIRKSSFRNKPDLIMEFHSSLYFVVSSRDVNYLWFPANSLTISYWWLPNKWCFQLFLLVA